ncbi:MAG TPA: response regulator [Terriglobia bacterium]|nr:response regulator [Terriglobia bacterium]
MTERVRALLVYQHEGPLEELRRLLEMRGFLTARAPSLKATVAALSSHKAADVIFTDTDLADGSWADVEELAQRERPPVPVIVVSNHVDIPLYLDALEAGASDFIVPPFRDADLDFVVRGALLKRVLIRTAPVRVAAGRVHEVEQHAENHSRSRVRTFYPQSGRQADRPLGGRA